MRYDRGAEVTWANVPEDAILRLRPHRRVDLPRYCLLVSADSPGWAAVPHDEIDTLARIDGKRMDYVLGVLTGDDVAGTLSRLYRAGLLAVDGETGLRGTPECRSHVRAQRTFGGSESARGSEPHEQPRPDLPTTLLIKLTGACNWSCTYCYDYDRGRFRKSLRLEDVAGAIEEIVDRHRRISIIFHGGEPLLQFAELERIVGFAVLRARAAGGDARFSLQTNGALITAEIIDFLDAHAFEVGMSIDGPPEINDLTRVDRRGRGTGRVLEALFRRHPGFMTTRVGFITTVTSRNVDALNAVASYLRDLGAASWKTAIFDAEGRGTASPELRPALPPYVAFLTNWLEECGAGAWDGFRFKNMLELIDTIASPKRPNMCLKFPCGAGREFIVAAADRGLMACDATYHPAFVLGRIDEGLAARQSSPNALGLFEREAWLLSEAECATCPWLHYCAGTCMAKALIQHGTIKAVDDFECAVRKAIFPILFDKLIEPDSRLRSYYVRNRQAARLGIS